MCQPMAPRRRYEMVVTINGGYARCAGERPQLPDAPRTSHDAELSTRAQHWRAPTLVKARAHATAAKHDSRTLQSEAERLDRASAARGRARRGACAPVHADRDAAPGAAFRLRDHGRARRGRSRGAHRVLHSSAASPHRESGSKHHRVAFGATALRWEQHSEFTTYTWELPSETGGTMPFHPPAAALAPPMAAGAAARAAAGRGRPASRRRRRSSTSSGCSIRRASRSPRTGDGTALYRHRLPGRSRRLRAHPDRRPRARRRARRRAGPARARDRDLPHARPARPAGGAAARARRCAASRCGSPKSPRR